MSEFSEQVDMPEGDFLRLLIRLQLERWLRAVEKQQDRLEEEGSDWASDGAFFAFALRNLHRAAEFARQVTGDGNVASAVHDFEKAVPGSKDLRDVLEHFDEYTRGVGDLQQPGIPRGKRRPQDATDPWKDKRRRHAPPGSFGFQGFRSKDDSIFISAGELKVDTSAATDAARELVSRILPIVQRPQAD